MTWWQIVLVFAGIPASIFVAVTVLVLHFATARVPDGLAGATMDPHPETDSEPAASARATSGGV